MVSLHSLAISLVQSDSLCPFLQFLNLGQRHIPLRLQPRHLTLQPRQRVGQVMAPSAHRFGFPLISTDHAQPCCLTVHLSTQSRILQFEIPAEGDFAVVLFTGDSEAVRVLLGCPLRCQTSLFLESPHAAAEIQTCLKLRRTRSGI